MGGHHAPKLPKIPDWRIYKVEDAPQLMQVQKALASLGLRDPWLRNEVWRYTELENKYPFKKYFFRALSTGFKYGLPLAIATTFIENALFGGDHGDHGEHGEQGSGHH